MKLEDKIIKNKIILAYTLLGPPIGGLFLLVSTLILDVHLSAILDKDMSRALGFLLYMFILVTVFSYPFGLIPAFVCGNYSVRSIIKKRTFSSGIYYALAVISIELVWIFSIFLLGSNTVDFYSRVTAHLMSRSAVLHVSASLFSAFVMLHLVKRIHQTAEISLAKPTKADAP